MVRCALQSERNVFAWHFISENKQAYTKFDRTEFTNFHHPSYSKGKNLKPIYVIYVGTIV